MDQHTGKRIAAALTLAGMGALAGCAGTGVPGMGGTLAQGPLYRCDNGAQWRVQFVGDTALISDASGQEEVLLRDAGGQGPQQAVFSNSTLRAQFGLGAEAREAALHYFAPPVAVRCLRD
jgi:hypothetical protein